MIFLRSWAIGKGEGWVFARVTGTSTIPWRIIVQDNITIPAISHPYSPLRGEAYIFRLDARRSMWFVKGKTRFMIRSLTRRTLEETFSHNCYGFRLHLEAPGEDTAQDLEDWLGFCHNNVMLLGNAGAIGLACKTSARISARSYYLSAPNLQERFVRKSSCSGSVPHQHDGMYLLSVYQ